jgi:predicted aspartyl protease
MKALLDTGASHTFINRRTVNKNSIKTSRLHDTKIKLANGSTDEATNMIQTATLEYSNKKVKTNIIVLNNMNDKYDIVLGINTIRQMKISVDRTLNMCQSPTQQKPDRPA